MKKTILILLCIVCLKSSAQNYGNEIRAKANDLSIGFIKRTGDALKVSDSTTHAKLTTIYTTGIPITGSVAVTGTFWQATQPVSNAGTFAVQASQSGTWNIGDITGTVSLPTGASTLAEQQTQTTSLQLLDDATYASDAAIDKVLGIGGQFDDVSPGTTTENSVRSFRMSTRRELYNQIRDAAGNERGANVNASNELLVALSSLPAGTNNIGDVDILSFPDNEPFNIAQINGVTPLMGAGNGGTGSLRVNIASDQVAIPVTLAATTITGTVAVTKSGTWDITNAGTFPVQPSSATAPIMSMNSASANSGINSAMAGVFDDAAITSITENNFGFRRMGANRHI